MICISLLEQHNTLKLLDSLKQTFVHLLEFRLDSVPM